MYKLKWKFESHVRLFPYFGNAKKKKVVVEDSKYIIQKEKLDYYINILKNGNYEYSVERVFPKWLELN